MSDPQHIAHKHTTTFTQWPSEFGKQNGKRIINKYCNFRMIQLL